MCLKGRTSDCYVSLSLVILLQSTMLIWTTILMVVLYRKRVYFPVAQRSPLLTQIQIGVYYISQIRISLHYLQDNCQFDLPNMEDISYALATSGQISFIISYFFKITRLSRSGGPLIQRNEKIVMNLYRSEKTMFTISISAGIILLLPILLLFLSQPEQRDYYYTIFIVVILQMDQMIYMYGAYTLRMMESDYSISSEIWSTLSTVYFMQILLMCGKIYDLKQNEFYQYIYTLFGHLLLLYFCYFAVIRPVRKIKRYSMALNDPCIMEDVSKFIQNKICRQSFEAFIDSRNPEYRNECLILKESIKILLKFDEFTVRDFDLTSETSAIIREQIFNFKGLVSYYRHVDTFDALMNSYMSKSIHNSDNNYRICYIFRTKLEARLKQIYIEEFQLTSAFQTLNKWLNRTSLINENLKKLNMAPE